MEKKKRFFWEYFTTFPTEFFSLGAAFRQFSRKLSSVNMLKFLGMVSNDGTSENSPEKKNKKTLNNEPRFSA